MRIIKNALCAIAAAIIIGLICGYLILRSSLPIISGEYSLQNLAAKVVIERDKLGIPTIYGQSRLDVAVATGFVHAQDRYFQMDLMRRATAGELAELFGESALSFDKERRIHRLRARAIKILQNSSDIDRQLLQAYANGVNQCLNSLSVPPFEYLVMRLHPRAWTPEDTLLVCFSLFFELQDANGEGVIDKAVMQKILPPEVYNFFVNNGSQWEAALDGSKLPMLAIPQQHSFAYLNASVMNGADTLNLYPKLGGSNQWAVTGSKSHNGNALLACDMHLGIAMPNTWYRAAFIYQDGGEEVKIYGATLPGTPMMVIGSNTHIAWGFTNSEINTTDITTIDASSTKVVTESILVKDQAPCNIEITESTLGPALENNIFGEAAAIRWLAHQPDAINLRLMGFEKARTVHEALEIAKEVQMPILNLLIADKNANIAWTLIGVIPDHKLSGNIARSAYPTLINPPDNILWTANNRTMGGEWLKCLNQSAFASGIRAYQIREHLLAKEQCTEIDMLVLQLDIKASFFDRWHALMMKVLDSSYAQKHRYLLEAVRLWDGQCRHDSLGYFWIRQFRHEVIEKVTKRILAPCFEARHQFLTHFQDFEEPIWLIVSQQPDYLADGLYDGWNEELLSYIDAILSGHEDDYKTITWGEHNPLYMRHPFSAAFPYFNALLSMPETPMSGDFFVPKVARFDIGASQRMVVSPGREDLGIFHMPGGQSGHPLSPFYRAGHEDWLEGRPSSFLPGKVVYKLTLLPAHT